MRDLSDNMGQEVKVPPASASMLQDIVDEAVRSIVRQFSSARLRPEEMALTLVDIQDPKNIISAGHRETEPIYPASIVKLFYAVAAYHWLKQGKLEPSPEFNRAMRDMIVDSSNDATSYIVDILTGTTSGPELPPDAMKEWTKKRNSINDFFKALGYKQLNANQKPWSDGPYGRERIFVGEKMENRNLLSTKETARLLTEIVLRKAAAPIYCDELLKYMFRDRSQLRKEPDDQTHDYAGAGLPFDAKFWSKAGWTSTVRHDAVYTECGDKKFILVAFTVNHAKDRDILRSLASRVAEKMAAQPGSRV
jgi:hypothetical protein